MRPGGESVLGINRRVLYWHIAYGPFPTVGFSGVDTVLRVNDVRQFGFEGDPIVLGDWDGNGTADLGNISKDPVFTRDVWVYRWWLAMPTEVKTVDFGGVGTKPVVGNWDGRGGDNIGVVWERPNGAVSMWQLDTNNDIHMDIAFEYGLTGDRYLVGRWKDITPPTATLASVTAPQLGGTHVLVQMQFHDNVAIDASTIDNGDIRVTGPMGNSLPIVLHSKDSNANGTLRTATYRVTAPGGTWDPSDNAIWMIYIQPNQIRDTSGNPVAGTRVGELKVDLTAPPPTATLIAPTLPKPGDTHMAIQVRYTSDAASGAAINVSSIDSADIRVVGPTGNSLPVTLQGIDVNTNGSPRIATYRITAPGGTLGGFPINLEPPPPPPTSPGPSATAQAGDVTKSGGTMHRISVTYTGHPALECSTISQYDIYVIRESTGEEMRPSNSVREGVCLQPSTLREIRVHYDVNAPGGTWDPSDNGTYHVHMRANEVWDTIGRSVPADRIGEFKVNISAPAPTATLIAPTAPKAGAPHMLLQVRYANNVAINVSSIDGSDIQVKGPDGKFLSVAWQSTSSKPNGSPRTATYRVSAPDGGWQPRHNGPYEVFMVANQVTDTLGNAVPAGRIGTFQLNVPDTVAPTAKLQGTLAPKKGDQSTSLIVVYEDNVAIDVSTIDSSDLRVTGPNRFSVQPKLKSVIAGTNGTPRLALYEFTAPGGTWDGADNGVYTVSMLSNQVRDTSRNAVKSGELGRFTVNVPAFDIALKFLDSRLTASQQAIVRQAAARWEEIIIGDIPAFSLPRQGINVDDLEIWVSATTIDAAGDTLGQAKCFANEVMPCLP